MPSEGAFEQWEGSGFTKGLASQENSKLDKGSSKTFPQEVHDDFHLRKSGGGSMGMKNKIFALEAELGSRNSETESYLQNRGEVLYYSFDIVKLQLHRLQGAEAYVGGNARLLRGITTEKNRIERKKLLREEKKAKSQSVVKAKTPNGTPNGLFTWSEEANSISLRDEADELTFLKNEAGPAKMDDREARRNNFEASVQDHECEVCRTMKARQSVKRGRERQQREVDLRWILPLQGTKKKILE